MYIQVSSLELASESDEKERRRDSPEAQHEQMHGTDTHITYI